MKTEYKVQALNKRGRNLTDGFYCVADQISYILAELLKRDDVVRVAFEPVEVSQ